MSTDVEVVQQKKEIVFKAFGSQENVKLTTQLVRRLWAKPVAYGEFKGTEIDDDNATKFMLLCRARQLNPAEGDAYCVGFSGKNGIEWSLITAHQALLKRAESHQDFEGMKSGVIIWPPWECKPCKGTGLRKSGDRETDCEYCDGRGERDELQGDFVPPEAKDGTAYKLLGGWARVYRKGKITTYRRLAVVAYEKNFGLWLTNKAMMIVKCAEADALRSTFPNVCGGMFTMPGEVTITGDAIDVGEPETKRPELPPGTPPVTSKRTEKRANVTTSPPTEQKEQEKQPEEQKTEQKAAPEQQKEPEKQQGGQPPEQRPEKVPPFNPGDVGPEEEHKLLVSHIKDLCWSMTVEEPQLIEFAKKKKLAGTAVKKITDMSLAHLLTIANSYQTDPIQWKQLIIGT